MKQKKVTYNPYSALLDIQCPPKVWRQPVIFLRIFNLTMVSGLQALEKVWLFWPITSSVNVVETFMFLEI